MLCWQCCAGVWLLAFSKAAAKVSKGNEIERKCRHKWKRKRGKKEKETKEREAESEGREAELKQNFKRHPVLPLPASPDIEQRADTHTHRDIHTQGHTHVDTF